MTIVEKSEEQKLAVQKDVENLVAASQKYMQHNDVDGEASLDLQRMASKLTQTLRGPIPSALSHFEDIVQMAALRTLLEAGVFHTIPKGGASMSADEISAQTGLDKNILIRLMRAVTPRGPFRETGEEEYAHTPYSKAYLTSDILGCFPVMSDFIFGPILGICEFLRQNEWKNTITTRNNPFTLAFDCPGETMFEYLYKNPQQVSRVAKAEAADPEQIAMDVFPWEERLGASADDKVAIVDIGGSHGNALRQIKKDAPGLKGRLILQDLEPVILEHGKTLRADGFETMVYDFFKQTQPVQGALIYYFRRIFHDWPDTPESKQILQNTAASMSRDSRILIHDIIVPEVGATMSHAWHDISLLAIGGVERTEKDFARLLDDAGLEVVKVWKKSGDMLGIVEACLK
ncbi:O-methyltransferase [Penicillium coprophilum]|uniref:O-methyltransferase n=1 Tax=Penicillium coprophilum TaxID=36646 RepID=UPI0023842937|nr:O-methyltransferase [Penicillium coprophilum]KAJ5162667.1 O-methyltransferase [Penicillium coprophilum]